MSLRDRLAGRLSRSPLGQRLVLVAGPVLLYGLMWAVNALSGTASAPGCGVHGILLDTAEHAGVLRSVRDNLPFLRRLRPPASACGSVPFSADITNQTLAITAGLAASIYLLFNLRIRFLRQQLEETGLITGEGATRSGLADVLARSQWRVSRRTRWLFNGGLAVACALASGLMYSWTYSRGPIFADLAASYSRMLSPGVTAESLRDSWWANHQHYPLHTAFGVTIGTIGLFFAAKQGLVFLNVALLTWRIRELAARAPVEFVPRWLDEDHGWRPCAGVVSLGYLSAFTFITSFAAALYMLRTDEPGLFRWLAGVLAVIATLGVVANAGFLGNMTLTIKKLFAVSVDRERTRLKERLAAGTDSAAGYDRLYHLTQAIQMADTRSYPLTGRGLRLLAAAPVLLAFLKFVDEATRAFGVVL